MCCGQSLGIRDRDEVVVVGHVPTKVEMRWEGSMVVIGWCSSGEVHGPQGVVVNLNSFGQRLGVPTVTLTRHMAALSAAEWREEDRLRSMTNNNGMHAGKLGTFGK